MLDGSGSSSSGSAPFSETDAIPINIAQPKQLKPQRKRPKTQNEVRLDVQELHMEVLKLEKEKGEVEKKNPLLKWKKIGAPDTTT